MELILTMSDVRKLVLEKFPFIGEDIQVTVNTSVAYDNSKAAIETRTAMSHINSHCKIEAIKHIRQVVGSNVLGLKECKDLVEDPRAEEKIFSLFQAYIKG